MSAKAIPFSFLGLKKFLIRMGVLRLRTKYRLFLWKAERVLFKAIRRKKKVCILIRPSTNAGLFAIVRDFLGGIAYADRHGMLPVVDMKNVISAYLFEDEVGYVNAWEYYFEQPSGISLEEAECSKETVRLTVGKYPVPRQDFALFTNQDGQLDYWRGICRKYIRFSQAVLDRLEHEKTKFSGKKVLGVSLRGTDYTALKLRNHAVQPAYEQVIAKASETMKAQNYDALYLSTEDKKIIAAFTEAFGEKLILPEGEYVDFDDKSDKWITLYSTHRKNDKYLMGLEYVVSKLLLVECNGFITSITNGSATAMMLSKGWEYLYVFDLGLY